MLLQQSASFNKGINEFTIESAGLESEGLLIYRVETEDASVTHKMILLR